MKRDVGVRSNEPQREFTSVAAAPRGGEANPRESEPTYLNRAINSCMGLENLAPVFHIR